MKVATQRFKEAVNKAIKGASFNNLIPITGMVGIKLKDGKLRLLTTDMTNTLAVILDKVTGDEMDITIDADKFGKLISKVTSEDIDLSVKDDVLVIKANGTYRIPLISDEDGLVSFPDIRSDSTSTENWAIVKLSSIMQAYNINKSALAKTLENPALTGYYCDGKVITTDANVITFNNFRMFTEEFEPLLISAQQMQLLTLYKEEDIKVTVDQETIVFATDTQVVEGSLMEGIEDFPVEEIAAYLDVAFTSYCKVPKELLLSVLDRLALFIEPYDKNGAYFTFGRKGINIHSKKDASMETINYVESKDFEPFVCCVDIPMLKEQLQAYPEETVKIWYGNENALKLECGKVIQVIALLEDEELAN
jgi:hypothetical protein